MRTVHAPSLLMPAHRILLLTSLLATSLATSSAQIGFGPPQTLAGPPATLTNPIVLIDLDSDGGHDVFQPYFLSSVTGMARNVPAGLTAISTIPALPLIGTLHAVDLDGDGVEDLVSESSPGIRSILGHGHGRFSSPITSAGSQPINYDLAVGDFDNDGFPDALVCAGPFLASQLDFRPGLGDGSFGPEQAIIPTGMNVSKVGATGHLDDNGLLDAVITTGLTAGATKIFCLMNRGGGVFDVVEDVLPSAPIALTLADLDGDGRDDLVMHGGGALRVLEGLGDGTFAAAQTLAFAGSGTAAIDDFDRDGHPDIAYQTGSPGTVQFFRQSQALRFEPGGTSSGWPTGNLLSADFDHDGFPDLVSASQVPGLTWAPNRGTTTPHFR